MTIANTASNGRVLRISASLAGLLGLTMLAIGLLSFGGSPPLPRPLSVALLITGFIECLLGWYAVSRVRIAWSFLLSLNATLALVLLFSAPKIRDMSEFPFAVAIAPAFLCGALVILLALVEEEKLG